jgi:hypothetical protein
VAEITYEKLIAFDAATFKNTAASWKLWALAVEKHSKDLKDQVSDPLQSNWSGLASSTAQSNLEAVQGTMSISTAKITSIESTLSSAATTIETQRTNALNALATISADVKPVSVAADGTVTITIPPTMEPNVEHARQTAASAATTKIRAAVAAANTADQTVATALAKLMPPSTGPHNGPGTSLSSDPGSNSGDSGSNGSNGSTGSTDGGSTQVSSVSAKTAMALGEKMAAARGWSGQQWTCLQKLWVKESGWNAAAKNPSSGAFGIPQSLPADKMASAGSDWATNPATQIKWGLDYIAGRYGNPCGAWSHEVSNNWY